MLFVPTLIAASVIVFAIMRAIPGDVALVVLGGSGESTHDLEQLSRIRQELGLDQPLVQQYGQWILSIFNGELGGRSLESREPIASILRRQLPITLLLTGYSIILATMLSIPLGILSARRQDQWPDYLLRGFAITGQTIPSFVMALVIILTIGLSAALVRITRATMLELQGQDFVRTARGKGLSEYTILLRHTLRMAAIPILTVSGTQAGILLSGAVVLESIFGLPGIGRGIVQAVNTRDYPVIQALSLFMVLLILAINFLIDLFYVFIDRRITYSDTAANS
jgi:peptide/nickel transport system permease protein